MADRDGRRSPRPALPLSARLTRRLAVIAGAAFLATVGGFALYYAQSPDYLLEAAVARRMDQLGRSIPAGPSGAATIDPALRALFDRHPESYAFALLDGEGRVLDGANLHLLPPPARETGMFATEWVARPPESPGVLVASHRIGDPGAYRRLVFVVRSDPAGLVRDALLREFVEHALVPLAPSALLLLLANALMIRRGLAPLARAAAWARSIRPGARVAEPPADDASPEIADLVSAASSAMDRLSEALDGERRRAAEAAHALRTPVAVLTARVDALPRSEAVARLREDVAALARTVRQVLDATSAEMLTVRQDSAVDLAAVAEETVAALAPFGFERGVTLGLDIDPGAAPAIGDPRAIGLAIANLVENAILHGGRAAFVTVGPGPVVSVEDDGPGLPRGNRDRLFEPFRRGPSAPPGGAGLGLAIVARTQRALGGVVEAAERPGGGARFTLTYREACGGSPQSRQVRVRERP